MSEKSTTEAQPVEKTNAQDLPEGPSKFAKSWTHGLRVLSLLLAAVAIWHYASSWSSSSSLTFTPAQLSLYNGSDPALPIYVALDGTVYDVTAGSHFYGVGGTYNVLAGKDAARAFVTGCFEDDNPDLRGAELAYAPMDPTDEELNAARKQVETVLDGWRQVFSGKTGKPYVEVGRLLQEDQGSVKALCEAAQKKRPARR